MRVACGSKLWENARNASAIERCGGLPLPPHLRGRGGAISVCDDALVNLALLIYASGAVCLFDWRGIHL